MPPWKLVGVTPLWQVAQDTVALAWLKPELLNLAPVCVAEVMLLVAPTWQSAQSKLAMGMCTGPALPSEAPTTVSLGVL